MSPAALADPLPAGWLRSKTFDGIFIAGVTALALAAGAIVVVRPELFPIVLAADLWLLGYHHVIATFTRLAFDRQSLHDHRFLVFVLPLLVIGATFALAVSVGTWVITSLYLYWQWFHYTRQSWGISQVYRAKANGAARQIPRYSKLVFYLVPTWGILHRSWQAPDVFLTSKLRVIPTPGWLVTIVGVAAIVAVGAWIFDSVRAWRRGRLPKAHTAFLASHFVVFVVGYGLIEDITHGWLVLNVWHNAQYVLFVWLFNAARYKDGVDVRARFLSTISQAHRKTLYFVTCLGLTTLFYGTSMVLTYGETIAGVSIVLILYQGINFHHYIVDSRIWKVRRGPLRATLGLDAGRMV